MEIIKTLEHFQTRHTLHFPAARVCFSLGGGHGRARFLFLMFGGDPSARVE